MKHRQIRKPFIAAAAVPALYFIILKASDPDKILSFSLVWLCLGVVLLILAFPESKAARFLDRTLWKRKKRRSALCAVTSIFGAVSLVIAAYIMTPVEQTGTSAGAAERYMVILGGGLRQNGELSTLLRRRLDSAIPYLQKQPAMRVVVSGGKLPEIPRSEGEAMAEYLVAKGSIQIARIIQENESKDTIQNMAYTKNLIQRDAGAPDGTIPGILLLTSDFHLKRALYLARTAGFPDIRGISSPCPPLYLPNALLREVGAWWKLGIREGILCLRGKPLFSRQEPPERRH